jgi:hypothetical protein
MHTRKTKAKNIIKAKKKVCKLLHSIYTSKNEFILTKSMIDLKNSITENKSVLVFEDSRYLLNSRELQKIKEIHYRKPSWTIIKPHYTEIFTDLYHDLDPNTDDMSNRELEDIHYTFKCKTKKMNRK